jgi:hypothetical protein
VPARSEARVELARRIGYREPRADDVLKRFVGDWSAVRAGVRRHFEALVLGGDA